MVEDDEGSQRFVWPTKTERLQVFYRQLKEAPAVTGMDEAVELLARTLLSVEDRISGIERGPGTRDDGRMYPAKADNRHAVPGRSDIVRYRSRAHNAYISTDGAILIVDLRGKDAFSKPGANGKVIEL